MVSSSRATIGAAASIANALFLTFVLVTSVRLTGFFAPASATGAEWGASPLFLAEQTVRLLLSAAALVGVYELDARINGAAPRVMRVATEIGVIAAALLFTASALAFRLAVPGEAPLAPAQAKLVLWIANALGVGALPGFGLWALLSAWFGLQAGQLPRWGALAGLALGPLGVAALVIPAAATGFAAVAVVWWAAVGATLARPGAPTST